MSAVQRGNGYEREVKKYLERMGWVVFRQHKKQMYINGKMIMVGADVFGCDLIAKKKGERSRWIQVSTDGQKSAKKKQLLMWPWNSLHEDCEIWLRTIGKKKYEIFRGPFFESEGFLTI